MVQAVAPVMAPRALAPGLLALGLLAAMLPGSAAAQSGPKLTVPPGFAIDVFADKVGSVRFMAIDPAGTLLVSEPSAGRVLALPDKNGDGKADSVQTVVTGLDQPHGLAFHDGALYIAETSRVQRFAYDPATMKATQPAQLARLPSGGGHWTRTVVFGPDGRMYVSVGSSCNVCRESDKRRAAILRFNADGSGEQLFSTGLRNAVGLAIHPATGALWATVNERDWRGDDLPPDYVTEVREGSVHGWPDCVTVRGRPQADTSFAKGAACDKVAPPSVELQAHSAPIGLAFYTGTQFPEEYRGSLFVAYRGSWNRTLPTGYKIVRIRFRDGQPTGSPLVEDFATGWLEGTSAWGRPVDLVVGRDGALYLSDQGSGRIYRITHRP
ncbi:MAG TPA: PQQ-dependent sugar dehydrogenase [Methylomirabilota bacterium]|nr:PQQ-dependent sugar dehydrogenase [Methylomirabilota bacterium]